MNNLFATWHRSEDEVDLADEPDVVDLLSRAYECLARSPGLEKARRLVDIALDEVAAALEDDPSYAAAPR